jgi:hypothetical protein
MAEDRDRSWAVVNTVLNLRVHLSDYLLLTKDSTHGNKCIQLMVEGGN